MRTNLRAAAIGSSIRNGIVIVACAVACMACRSVPKAPTVSDTHRRPVNSSEAIELQSCRGQLKNTELLLQETAKLATSASSALANTAARCSIPKASAPSEASPPGGADPSAPGKPSAAAAAEGSKVYVLLFPYGSTQVDLLDQAALELAAAAAHAPLIEIRGRTDGAVDEAGNQRVARGRAESVRDYLVATGVEPSHIRVTYQAVGDQVADNRRADGRALNRRAEVEIYAVPPEREVLMTHAQSSPAAASAYVSR